MNLEYDMFDESVPRSVDWFFRHCSTNKSNQINESIDWIKSTWYKDTNNNVQDSRWLKGDPEWPMETKHHTERLTSIQSKKQDVLII